VAGVGVLGCVVKSSGGGPVVLVVRVWAVLGGWVVFRVWPVLGGGEVG